jgi:hypothetical protein
MTIVAGGLTVIDPFKVAVRQLFPVVTKVKLNGDPEVEAGVPEIVIVDPTSEAVTPVGKPVTVAAVAPPPMVYVIGEMASVKQMVWNADAGAVVKVKVWIGSTVMLPESVATAQVFPVVVIA